MGNKKEFLKDSLFYGLGNGIKKFIGFFLLPFYTRALTPEDYGLLSTLSTFTMLLSAFLNIGLDSASGYYFFQAKEQKEKGRVLFTHFILRLIGIIPPLLLSFFSARLSLLFFNTEDYAWLIFISVILVPVNLLMSEQSHIYRYYRKPWQYNLVTIVKSIINIGVGISLVVILKFGVIGAQLASIISSAVVVVGSFILFSRRIYTWSFSFFWAKKMLSFGFPLIWAGLASWIYNVSDRFFLLHYRNLAEIGYYSIGNTLSQPVMLINMAVQMSFGVLFFKFYYEEADENKPISKKMAIDSFNLYLGGAVLLASFLSIFGVNIVSLFATKDYNPGAIAIPFLAFSAIAGQAYQLMGPGITLAEKNWHFTWLTVVTAIVNTILNFLLIPKWGFIGASMSTLFSLILYWFLKQVISQHYFNIPYPVLKISTYFMLGMSFSIIISYLEYSRNIMIPLLFKTSVMVILISTTFLFKLIPLKIVIQLFKRKIQ